MELPRSKLPWSFNQGDSLMAKKEFKTQDDYENAQNASTLDPNSNAHVANKRVARQSEFVRYCTRHQGAVNEAEFQPALVTGGIADNVNLTVFHESSTEHVKACKFEPAAVTAGTWSFYPDEVQ
jgi:hypothetical protein